MITDNVIIGFVTMGGALAYNIWGFINALQSTKETEHKEKFNWTKAAITVIPSLILGFLAGYQMNPDNVVEYFSLLTSGFGIAAAQGRLGINSFFD